MRPVSAIWLPARAGHARPEITARDFNKEQGYQAKVDNVVFRPNAEARYKAEQATRQVHSRLSVAGEALLPLIWVTSKSLKPLRRPATLQTICIHVPALV